MNQFKDMRGSGLKGADHSLDIAKGGASFQFEPETNLGRVGFHCLIERGEKRLCGPEDGRHMDNLANSSLQSGQAQMFLAKEPI